MRLQEIFNQLTHGEFSMLSIGGQAQGEINESNYPRVVDHVNLGLTALFKRFNLKKGELKLQMQEDHLLYRLRSEFAVNNLDSTELVRYIIDTVDAPFEDDIIKVESVVGSIFGELPLNDAAAIYSVTTPKALLLRVPEILDTQMLTLTYQANHPKLVVDADFNPHTLEVDLPETHLEALLFYVASRVNNPIGMANEFHAGNSYAAKYEMACQELEGKGLQIDRTEQYDKIRRNGWV
jgi:hypothetical protein